MNKWTCEFKHVLSKGQSCKIQLDWNTVNKKEGLGKHGWKTSLGLDCMRT